MRKKNNASALIILMLLLTVLLVMLFYKPLVAGIKANAAEAAELQQRKDDLADKQEDLDVYFPAEMKTAEEERDRLLAEMTAYDNNYDYHYILVNLAEQYGLGVKSLDIGEPSYVDDESLDFSSYNCVLTVRTVIVSLTGRLENFLGYADAVGELGENVRLDAFFSPINSSEGYVLTSYFYELEEVE